MKRSATILFGVVAVLVVGVWGLRQAQRRAELQPLTDGAPEPVASNAVVTTAGAAKDNTPPQLLGETILRDYAKASLPPENDLTLLSQLMGNSVLLLKAGANYPLSANEDWAALLLGRNGTQERFLPDKHVAVNAQGQLVDRWGSPLFFHADGGGRYEIRSAGPDRVLWNADDLHRNADGSFRRGENLNPASLNTAGVPPPES